MNGDFTPILVLVAFAALVCAAMVTLSWVLGPKRVTPYKQSPYECGVEPSGSARERFPIKFYLVAMIFILFDIEVVFMYPWAGVLVPLRQQVGEWITLVPMGIFLLILIVGLVYEWSKGALEWGD